MRGRNLSPLKMIYVGPGLEPLARQRGAGATRPTAARQPPEWV